MVLLLSDHFLDFFLCLYQRTPLICKGDWSNPKFSFISDSIVWMVYLTPSHSAWKEAAFTLLLSTPAGTWAPQEPSFELSPPALLSNCPSQQGLSIFHKVRPFNSYWLDNSASSHKTFPWNSFGYRKALWMYSCRKVLFLRHLQKILFKPCKSKAEV